MTLGVSPQRAEAVLALAHLPGPGLRRTKDVGSSTGRRHREAEWGYS